MRLPNTVYRDMMAKNGKEPAMRRTSRGGSRFLCFLINLLLNLEWTIPAWIALALHHFLHISIWWFWGALALWVIATLLSTLLFSALVTAGSEPPPPKENKNPYSKKNSDYLKK
ncbi:MAG: hypothetical protein IJB22_00975 [Clostridia bacterium]|nr:hypothetical protein [Clostridia bacterium]